MDKNQSKFKVFNIQLPDVPEFKETFNRQGFIEFGYNNTLPTYYLSLLNRSALHNAIVTGKAQMIGGNGFDKHEISNQGYAFLMNSLNSEGMDLEEILSRISFDLEIFGAFALYLVWDDKRKKIQQIEHISPETLRIAKPNPKFPHKQDYYLCDNWSDWRRKGIEFIPGFSLTDRKEAGTILYVREYRSGAKYYGSPGYMPGARWCELEYEISSFHLHNIKNGFAPSLMINYVDGPPPSDEAMEFEINRMKSEYKGARGTGEVIFTWSEGKDRAPVITPIETNSNDNKFIALTTDMRQGIINAHRVNDPTLFGIRDEGGLHIGQSEILDALEMFQTSYVTPKQRLIEKALQRIANINGVPDKITISEYKIKYSKMDLQVSDILSILTSPLQAPSKMALLTSSGYTEDEASKLLGTDVNGVAPTGAPTASPTGGTSSTVSDAEQSDEQPEVNVNVQNLTAKQHQQLLRIIRQFNKGQITQDAATVLLKSGLGFTDEQILSLLGVDDNQQIKNNI